MFSDESIHITNIFCWPIVTQVGDCEVWPILTQVADCEVWSILTHVGDCEVCANVCVISEVVALTVNTSVTFGQGAVLVCVGYGEPSVTVTWKSNTEVTSTSRVTIIEEDLSQDGRLFLQSFLQLCSVDISHAGNYTCTVTNGSSSTSANTELTVTGMFSHQLSWNSDDISLSLSLLLPCRCSSGVGGHL